MTHTPGPWDIGTNEGYPNHIEAADPFKRGHLNLVKVAEAFSIGDDGDGQLLANMRLISAAPDLLEALRKIERLDVKDSGYLLSSEAFLTLIERLQDVARSAIAKATGETA